ncbi:hypothetical protein ACFTWS_36170, partial [Streptomyces sp. NPDC057027]|uniref:hypothetical protein n=1 Tax=Streptomyces sp. NPDC057027 TaxID=3346004 RepID=UPI003624C60F
MSITSTDSTNTPSTEENSSSFNRGSTSYTAKDRRPHHHPATELDWVMSDRSPDGGRSVPVALNCEIRAGRR